MSQAAAVSVAAQPTAGKAGATPDRPAVAPIAPAALAVPAYLQARLQGPAPIQRTPAEELAAVEDEEVLRAEPGLQAKVAVGPPDDPYERAADAVADRVQRSAATPVPPLGQSSGAVQRMALPEDEEPLPVQRKTDTPCPSCAAADERLQAKQSGDGLAPAATESSGRVLHRALAQPGPGTPLPPPVRGWVEPVLGADLSGVRVHADAGAAAANRAIQARAFTHGEHIWLGPGESPNDLGLMAHEATHVVQQTGLVHRKPATEGGVAAAGVSGAGGGGNAPTGAAESASAGAAAATAPAAAATGPTLLMPEPPAGLSAEEQARIGAVQGQAGAAAEANAAMPPADAAVADARAAVEEPEAETAARAAGELTETLGERAAPSPEIEELCERIKGAIRRRRPPDEDALVQFDPGEATQAAGAELNSAVQGDAERVQGDYDQLNETPEGSPGHQAQPLETPPAAVEAPPVTATEAVPDAVPVEDVSLDADVAASSQRIEDAGMASEPAELITDPSNPVVEAREGQAGLTEAAARDPAEVMAEQTAIRDQAQGEMRALQQQALNALQGSRASTASGVGSGMVNLGDTEEQMRANAGTEAQRIFSEAQTQVRNLLDPLPRIAMERWETGIQVLSTRVEQESEQFNRWKAERYSGVGGAVLGVVEGVVGMPEWAIRWLNGIEERFGNDVCDLIRAISSEVNTVIATCEEIIDNANQQIAAVFAQLPASLQEWAAGEQANFSAQLEGLREQAHNTRNDFNQQLSQQAAQAVQDVRERIHAMREEAQGLLGQIANAIERFAEDPAKFIIEGLLKLVGIAASAFWALVNRIGQVIEDIADDPLGFANNLVAAIGQGFQRFFDNFANHIVGGFFDWLFSGLGSVGVQLPSDFSLGSLITFFLQLMGITWARVRQTLARHIGEQNVALLEKAHELIALLMERGVDGIYEMIREQLNPQTILDAILSAAVDFLIDALIRAVTPRIIGLFNPAGAIIQAIEVIFRVLAWIFNNAARIFSLVETVVNGAADLIAGNVGGMATAVEGALARLIAPVIDFLAGFLGLGNLPERIADTIRGFQQMVLAAIERVVAFLAERARALLRALGIGGDGGGPGAASGAVGDTEIGETLRFSAGDESHRLWVDASGAIMLASVPKPLTAYLGEFRTDAGEIADEAERGRLLALIGQVAPIAQAIESDARQAASQPIDSPQRTETDNRIEASERTLQPLLAALLDGLRVGVPERIEPAIAVRFTAESWLDMGEYTRQLGLQQSAINAMDVETWIGNRNRFIERRETQRAAGRSRPSGRHPESAQAQADLRATIRMNLIARLTMPANASVHLSAQPEVHSHLAGFVASVFARYSDTTRRNGLSVSTATREVNNWMRTQHALHSPDQVAGGRHDDLTGVGTGSVNVDIGANWGGFEKPARLADRLHEDVEAAMRRQRVRRAFWRQVRMNVNLST